MAGRRRRVVHHHAHRRKGYHVHRRKGLKHPHKGSHGHRHYHGRKAHPRRVVKHVTRHPGRPKRPGHHAKALAFLKLRRPKKDRKRVRVVHHRLVRFLRKPRHLKVSKG